MSDGTKGTAERLQSLSQQAMSKAALRATAHAATLSEASEALALLLIATRTAVVGDAAAQGAWDYALCALPSGYREVVEESASEERNAA